MRKHFVTFYSPGTFVHEETTREVEDWNVHEAVEMARGIKERHGATPFAFQFSTRERRDDQLDSHEVERSKRYYLGGKVLSLEEVVRRNDPDDETLIRNMKNNDTDRVLENCNSWKVVLPLQDGDEVLEFVP